MGRERIVLRRGLLDPHFRGQGIHNSRQHCEFSGLSDFGLYITNSPRGCNKAIKVLLAIRFDIGSSVTLERTAFSETSCLC